MAEWIELKIEPVDADDVCSSEAATSAEPAGAEGSPAAAAVKQDMDIEPTHLQPPDIHYKLRQCKSKQREGSPSQRKRVKRATSEQVDLLLRYMQTHPRFSCGKYYGKDGRCQFGEQWAALSLQLNDVPGGAKKNSKQWATVWRDIRYRSNERLTTLRKEHASVAKKPISRLDNPAITESVAKVFNAVKSAEFELPAVRTVASNHVTPNTRKTDLETQRAGQGHIRQQLLEFSKLQATHTANMERLTAVAKLQAEAAAMQAETNRELLAILRPLAAAATAALKKIYQIK